MATPSNNDIDGYVNGRAAAEVQNDRVRDDVRPDDDGAGSRATGRSPGLGGWIRRALRRVTGRSHASKGAVGATVGLLLLAACGSGADTSEVAGTQETQTATAEDTEAAGEADGADTADGEAVCEDPEDDSITVDQDAADSFEGDAYSADQVRIELDSDDEKIMLRTNENPDKLDKEPAGPLRWDLWLTSEDGSETGLVRVHSPSRDEFNLQVGTDEDSLAPVDGGSPRVVPGGSMLLNIDRTLLPVLDGPFRWALVETMEGNGTADICPNGASIDDPLADPDALASFPE